ncbi:unnamed protein product [Fusarium graminearum]|nr:unnamed protein product [Fusarium graminearum]CAG1960064.1 unnamed protein product [Fusarium graminearum]VTO84363.1 unnamed protein product [Fusarium graminearum]
METATALARKGYCMSHPCRMFVVSIRLSVHSWLVLDGWQEARVHGDVETAGLSRRGKLIKCADLVIEVGVDEDP